MPLLPLRRWFGRWSSVPRPVALPRRPYRPVLETLEDRLPPGTLLSVGPLGVSNVLGNPLVSPLPPSTPSAPTTVAAPTTAPTPAPALLPPPPPQPVTTVTTVTTATSATITSPAPAPTTSTSAPLLTTLDSGLSTAGTAPTGSTGGGATPVAPAPAAPVSPSGSTSAGSSGSSAPPAAAPSLSITGVSPDTGTSATDRITNATTLAIIGTATAGATVGVSVGGQFVMTQAAADGTFRAALPGTLSEGIYAITAVTTSGGLPAGAQSSVTIDRTPPRVLLQAPGYTVNPTPTVTVTAQGMSPLNFSGAVPLDTNSVGVDVDLQHDGSFTDPGDQNFGSGTLDATGVAQVTLGTLTPGTYQVRAHVADVAGNVGVSDVATMQVSGDPVANVPLGFAPNLGQTDPRVQYEALGDGYGIFLTGQGAVLSLASPTPTTTQGPTTPTSPDGTSTGGTLTEALTIGLINANSMAQSQPLAVDRLPGTANFFLGDDPTKWVSNAPTYSEVHYQDVYRGIDETFQGQQGSLEYTFLVHPGADPNQILLSFQGSLGASLDANGNLVLQMMGGTVTQSAPDVYQETASGKQEVGGHYVLLGPNQVGFQVNAYDTTRELIIDPTLGFSTYVGGTNNSSNGRGIAVDGTGVYVVGDSGSTDFPLQSPEQNKNNGGSDVVVFKLNPAGTSLIYSTYLGGGKDDTGRAIAIDGAGNAYVTGNTQSTDFPTTSGVVQTKNNGTTNVFVTKLNSTGSGLLYSTYYGGAKNDTGRGIAIDGAGDAFVTGSTTSTDFPTTSGVAQTSNKGGDDAFVFELNSAASAATFSTYLGGGKDDVARGIALFGNNIYIAGDTQSTDFPTTSGAFQTKNNGGDDAFVAELNGNGTATVYSTYLGGSRDDQANGIDVDASGNAYVVGTTGSNDFPTTPGVIQANRAGFNDAFVTELNPTGSALVYSTYLGGNFDDEGNAIKVDATGNAYVVGAANVGLPLQNPLPGSGFVNVGANQDFFLSVLEPGGTALQFSTYLGGFLTDVARGVAIDSSGNAYLVGQTHSGTFPTSTGAFQTVRGSDPTIAVARIDGIIPPKSSIVFPEDIFEPNDTSDKAAQLGPLSGQQIFENLTIAKHADGLPDYDWYRWSAATAGTFTVNIDVTQGGNLELHLWTLVGNTLVQLGQVTQSSAAPATLTLSAGFAAGQAILVEVKGHNSSSGVQDQGAYKMTVQLS